jgi:uncharacterized membrane protein
VVLAPPAIETPNEEAAFRILRAAGLLAVEEVTLNTLPAAVQLSVTAPSTVKLVSVPKEVTLGWAAVERVPARVVAVSVVIPPTVERNVTAPASVMMMLLAPSALLRTAHDVAPGTIFDVAAVRFSWATFSVGELTAGIGSDQNR